jgi:hypothetical protein
VISSTRTCIVQLAASSPSLTPHHRRSAGPRNSGVVVPARCAVVRPSPKTKMSSPDFDRSAIRRSSSLAGSPISAALLILCSSPAPGLLVDGNTAPRRIDTRPSGMSMTSLEAAATSSPAAGDRAGRASKVPQHSGSTSPNDSGAMAMPQDLWHRTLIDRLSDLAICTPLPLLSSSTPPRFRLHTCASRRSRRPDGC